MGKGVSLFLRLHAVWGSVMAINTAMCHSMYCEQTGRERKSNFVIGSMTLYHRCIGEVNDKL